MPWADHSGGHRTRKRSESARRCGPSASARRCGTTSAEASRAVGRVTAMSRRTQRQSWRMTRRELRKHLARDARKWVSEVWKAASETAARLDNLSPVTAPLGVRLVDSYAARQQASEEA